MVNTALHRALRALDPTNDEHWTDDGLPRMDAIKALGGGSGVTRAAVSDAAPGLTRAALLEALEGGEDDEGEEDGGPSPEELEQEEPAMEPDDEPAVEPEPLEDPGEGEAGELEPPTFEEVLAMPAGKVVNDYGLLKIAQEALAERGLELIREKKRIEEEIAQTSTKGAMLDRAEILLKRRNPGIGESNPIRDYLAAAARARAERAARARRFVEAGTTAEDVREQLASSSKLDRAMGVRKAALGSKRPAPRPVSS